MESDSGRAGFEERNVLIPLSDGVTLAADLRVPEDRGRVPVLMSFDPYRKDDISGAFSEYWRQYFVGRGYGHLLVDVRGTGGSAGTSADTFAPQEGIDGAEAVEWVADQPWCNGKVGVWGMSYGGAMALAVAARRPPHLRAVATVYGYSDVYGDSVYPGGCPTALGRLARETWMLALELAPPSFRDPAGRWLEVWRARLDRLRSDGVHSLRWRDHPGRDEFWMARVTEISQIEVPTFVIGGFRDIFPEAMVRVYEQLRCTKKLLMGPWLHTSPDASQVEPVDWLSMLTQWWDQHLSNRVAPDTDAPVSIYVQGLGYWRQAQDWPIPGTVSKTYHLSPSGALQRRAPAKNIDRYSANPLVGAAAGLWSPLGEGIGFPLDQASDDVLSLTYTSSPVEQDFEITGSPEAVLTVVLVEGDQLDLAVKLVDISPSGQSSLITTGWLRADGAIRASGDLAAEAAPPFGAPYIVQLWATSYCVRTGHRLRVSVACSDFPRVWPQPVSPVIDVHLGGGRSYVRIPVSPTPGTRVDAGTLPRPAGGADLDPWARDGSITWQSTEDHVKHAKSTTFGGWQRLALPDGTSFRVEHEATATVTAQHPEAAEVRASAGIQLHTPGGECVEVRASGLFHRDRQMLQGQVTEDGITCYEGVWANY